MTAGRVNTKNKDDWNTPTKIVIALYQFWDIIELDPCSNQNSIVNATTNVILPDNGLNYDFAQYKSIYINPPYGKGISRWILKASESNIANEIILLIPVATNTSYWKSYIFNQAMGICFLFDSRLKFRSNDNENNKGCPMACCLVYYGKDYERFELTFNQLGNVVKL